ncbi:MAG TPA: hypothetical protein DHU75_00685 [Rikenellaceae bacterium]|nr:hypothetical protein [Rikenellaceae bacterium]
MVENYKHDDRLVLTLDAGGTNLVFGAMRGCRFVTERIVKPSSSDDVDKCLTNIKSGFSEVMKMLSETPSAISFAFPGPADYANGVIAGDLPNFPAFRTGVALGAYLEREFNLPVYINNDGNLFAYGEAMSGALPWLNSELANANSRRRYHNLIGVTFGTGFGCGIVCDGKILMGDNGLASNLWCTRHPFDEKRIVEEGVSIRAIKRIYRQVSGDDRELEPVDIFEIAEGLCDGDVNAAKSSFSSFGRCAGASLATVCSLIDGVLVIGGGLTGASKYIMPSLMEELRGSLEMLNGEKVHKIQSSCVFIENEKSIGEIATAQSSYIKVHGTQQTIRYNMEWRTPVMLSRCGASASISEGAYVYALSQLDK